VSFMSWVSQAKIHPVPPLDSHSPPSAFSALLHFRIIFSFQIGLYYGLELLFLRPASASLGLRLQLCTTMPG
jgi:hypothetical protein